MYNYLGHLLSQSRLESIFMKTVRMQGYYEDGGLEKGEVASIA